MSHSNPSGSAI